MMNRVHLLSVLLMATLAACGFHLRGLGQAQLPFQRLYVSGAQNSGVVNGLKRAVQGGSQTTLAPNLASAQAELQVLSELREKIILSLNSAGKVREYELRMRVAYRLIEPKGGELLPASEIVLNRIVSFNDSQVLAKEAEETLLYRDMQNDVIQQIIRRLEAVKLAQAGG